MTEKKMYPKVMCTQHPDSISRYISTQEETYEAVEAAMKYGCDEYMPDYEGKTTPYHQSAQIVSRFIEETDLTPGKDIFITPRVPSAVHENLFRQLMVMMATAEANYISHKQLGIQAIDEVVHPMTSSVLQIIDSQQHMIDVNELAKKEFRFEMEAPRIIPLIEEVPKLLNAKEIIGSTINAYQEQLNQTPEKYRVFLGKSDSALTFGHVASTLSCKYAISELHELEDGIGIPIGIIFGTGALPFRGHMTLENKDNFFMEYKGIDTVTLQSALRFDHEKGNAEEFVRCAKDELSKSPDRLSAREKEELVNIIAIFGASYNRAIQQFSSTINSIADFLPQQRDRLMREGSTGYARDLPDATSMCRLCRSDIGNELHASMSCGSMNLPRAIKFTGALYSIGIPPEIIGTGSAIEGVREKLGDNVCERLLTRYFPSLRSDLIFAFEYLDTNTASRFLSDSLHESIRKEVDILRDIFDIETQCEPSYRMLLEMANPHLLCAADNGCIMDADLLQLTRSILVKMGKMRKSLG
ncbi:MAG: phosphoenolpyruvate carboxylase [Methanolobus sp.]|uniref:phosphoenolpyruvate carboxylase n=1 Tax=Methanolobus sp. TaxID=1874737 RepID=UPI00272F7C6A|nr:phosphoenolpyruvate carboxylase [Methanolobus sp.]MDP2216057.1 phosphoenolpyruvate carboxylase [Methanolobus sp.]